MNEDDLTASVGKWTDQELWQFWKSATDEETENPSALLLAVINEMGKRQMSF